ncbi:MAG: hypothetical protein IT476_06575 [Rhodanobacteraceae bacterium]|nr:hypothetical protein [Rhodanobacteraceae bacterium]
MPSIEQRTQQLKGFVAQRKQFCRLERLALAQARGQRAGTGEGFSSHKQDCPATVL